MIYEALVEEEAVANREEEEPSMVFAVEQALQLLAWPAATAARHSGLEHAKHAVMRSSKLESGLAARAQVEHAANSVLTSWEAVLDTALVVGRLEGPSSLVASQASAPAELQASSRFAVLVVLGCMAT